MTTDLQKLEAQAEAELQAMFSKNGNGPHDSENEPEPEARAFQPLTLTELFNQPDKQWLWRDLIGAGDVAMIFGEAGTAKTFAAVDLIVSGALGWPFARRFHPARPLKIAYCAGEGLTGIKGRFKAALNKYKAPVEALGVTVFKTVPQLFDSTSFEYVGRFVAELPEQTEQLDAVFIDTLHSATAGGDENSAKDAGVILRNAKYIAEALGVTVVLIHHANKAGGYRGSSALHGAMDTMLQTRREGENFTIECFKQKDAERFKPLFFKLAEDEYTPSARVEWLDQEVTDLNEEPKAVNKAKTQIVDILSTAGRAMNQTAIVEQTKAGRHSVLSALRELEQERAVEVNTVGNAKFYTWAV